MGSLLAFLLVGCVLSVMALASQSPALWTRLPLVTLLLSTYLLNLCGLGDGVSVIVPVLGLIFACSFLRWGAFVKAALRPYLGLLGVAVLVSAYIAFRPSLLEYPVDHIVYWQSLTAAAGSGSAEALTCSMGGPLIYQSYCTLWFKLAAAWPVSGAWTLTGAFVRLVHFGELLLLSLALIRLWITQAIRPISAAVMLVLVFAGMGYLYDAFVINHALQGSLLAAALFVEGASALTWIFGRLRTSCSLRSSRLLVASWYFLAGIYFLVLVKLHGLFALLMLLWILIVPLLLAALSLTGTSVQLLRRSTLWWFAPPGLALGVALFIARDAGHIMIPPNFAGVVLRWSDRLGLVGLGDWGPVSFLPRTSDTRPEALAVIGLLVALVFVVSVLRPGGAVAGLRSSQVSPAADVLSFERPEAEAYAILSSVYVISILIAYVLPPFSNLFLKLNPFYSSHMRLMWGACLISPLPCFLFLPFSRFRRAIAGASLIALTVILLPIQFSSGQRKQLFFSKGRHFIMPTPAWADPSHVASVLVPQLHRIAGPVGQPRSLRVIADPIVRSALYPFGFFVDPPATLGGDRFFQASQLPLDRAHSADDDRALAPGRRPFLLADVVIQQDIRDCFYSVYADMQAYEPCIAARVSGSMVNGWTPDLLRKHGYQLDWSSNADGYRIWRRPSTGSS